MEALRARLETWDRFVVVDRLSNADLAIAVRVGRRGTSIPLWRHHAPGGLAGELCWRRFARIWRRPRRTDVGTPTG
jgi:hypothetical protein